MLYLIKTRRNTINWIFINKIRMQKSRVTFDFVLSSKNDGQTMYIKNL